MGKKPSKSTGFFIVLTALAILILASWLFAFGGVEKISTKNVQEIIYPTVLAKPVNETYNFLTYRNPTRGFSLQYPVGFIAEEPFQDISEFRAYARIPGKGAEVIEVIIDNNTTAHAYFEELRSASQESGRTTTRVYKTSSGEAVRLVVTETLPQVSAVSNETSIVYQALFNCEDYTALLLVNIPQSLSQDLPLAEYMINSFKC